MQSSDNLRQIPEQLETLIGDKKFLQAALILGRSLKTINKPEIAELGAVSELRAYFVSQETVRLQLLSERSTDGLS
jgi:exocyst complex component 4